VLHIACNKLVRRSLMERMGLSFVDGWYEDVPFSYPLLLAASSLTTLPEPLLRYRQRQGAITASAAPRHMEVLTQWDRAMQKVGELKLGGGPQQAWLFPYMVRHCTSVLLDRRRIPSGLQDEFLAGLRQLYLRYYPGGGYEPMSRLERSQHRIVRNGSLVLLKAHWQLMTFIRKFIHR
jgi:CDP-glycerol glycerophosphotransferase